MGISIVISRGNKHEALTLQGILAEADGTLAGFLHYQITGDDCELVTLRSTVEHIGVGAGLIERLKEIARKNGCNRIWLVTTNENTKALRFYQKRGFHLKAIYPNALDHSRKLNPEIPLKGNDGIPLRDKIELDIILQTDSSFYIINTVVFSFR